MDGVGIMSWLLLQRSELRKKLIPDILGIVRRQRLQYIMEGTCFPKYGSRVGRIKGTVK